MVLAPHLCMVVLPHKFWPHLPKKYDGTINPTEFLQIYPTSILVVGGDEAGMAQSWLINLLEGTLTSW
jgi:hypothetical protein